MLEFLREQLKSATTQTVTSLPESAASVLENINKEDNSEL